MSMFTRSGRRGSVRGLAATALFTLVLPGCSDSVAPEEEEPPPSLAPAVLAFLTEPGGAVAGEAMNPAIRVAVLDTAGNLVRDAEVEVTVALAGNPGGASLSGSATTTSTGGVAAFEELSLDRAGSGYTLSASASGLGDVTSDPFAVTPAAPTRLAVVSQPDTVEGLVSFGSALEVEVQDAFGNLVSDAAVVVQVAVASAPAGVTDVSDDEGLAGNVSRQTNNGAAVFTDLRIGLPGDGWVLEATSAGLDPALTNEITVQLTFASVAAGHRHACGLTVAGFAYCWGANAAGRLGNGTFEASDRPTPVASRLRYDYLTIGRDHTCGRETGTTNTYCWGSNFSGQLGIGTTSQGARTSPELVADGHEFSWVHAGSFHTCGVTTANIAFCWGSNQDGALGDGTTTDSDRPVAVSGGLSFREVRGGNGHTCGVTLQNEAACWGGLNQTGAIGDGTTTQRLVPTAVAGTTSYSTASAGGAFSCGLATDDSAWCWGRNSDGRVGDGTSESRLEPVPVIGGLTFTQLEAYVFNACGLDFGGAAWCWGANPHGNLGDGTTEARHQPTPVAGGLRFSQLSVGTGLTCGLAANGSAFCWGRNDDGQVGDGTTEASLTPTRVLH